MGGKEDSNYRDIFDKFDTCKDHEILLALVQFYLVNEIEVGEGKEEDDNKQINLSHALYNHIKLRLFCLDIMK